MHLFRKLPNSIVTVYNFSRINVFFVENFQKNKFIGGKSSIKKENQ